MFTTLALRLALGLGISPRAAKFGLIAALVVAAILGLGIGKCSYDRSVVKNANAGQEAATAKADRRADTKAAEQRRADDGRLAQETRQLERAQSNAKTDVERRLARHRCLRAQQAARAGGREPPACD